MLFIQYNSQLCSKRLISNAEHLIINPPLQSVFNSGLLLSIISERDCTAAHSVSVCGGWGCGGEIKDVINSLGILGLMSVTRLD